MGKKIRNIFFAFLYIFVLGGALFFIRSQILLQEEAEKQALRTPTATSFVSLKIAAAPSPGLELLEEEPDDLDIDYFDEIDESMVAEDVIEETASIDDRVINILLMGEDTRSYETSSGRSDTMLLFSFNRDTGRVDMISLLRDIYIYIPGRDTWNRINTAFRYGGIGLAINTVNENFDLDISYYMEVDFEGIVSIVDIMGGIELELSRAEAEYINRFTGRNELHGGNEHLDGEQVLAHCRNRSTGDGDWGRTRRQRMVLFAMMNKAHDMDAKAVIAMATKLFKYVDTNLRFKDIVALGLEAIQLPSLDIQSGTLPFEDAWQYAKVDGKSVIKIDLEKNRELLHERLYPESGQKDAPSSAQ